MTMTGVCGYDLSYVLCMILFFHALWLFDVAKGGEKMGILEIKT